MVSPTNNLSALSPEIIKRFKLVARHPDTDALDYASFIHMDPAEISAQINLKHSKDIHWYVTKVHTYKSPQVKLLALIIAEHFNPQKGYSYPPQSLLSALLGINRQTVSKLTKELEASGYWAITRGHADVSTRYTLTPVEFSRLRDFLVAERTPNKRYLDGATFPRVMVNEARSRTNLKAMIPALKPETAPVPASAETTELTTTADEKATAPAVSAPVAVLVTPEPDAHQQAQAVDPVQDTDVATRTQAQLPAVVNDDELSVVVQEIINDGLCLNEGHAKGKVTRALLNERQSNPGLSAAELKTIATKNLVNRIATGQWIDFDSARLAEILADDTAPRPEEDLVDLLADRNEPNLPW